MSRSEPNYEMRFSGRDFQVIADLLRARTGIHLPPTKQAFVYSRLAPRLRQLGINSFRDYRNLLEGPKGADELGLLVNRLTTNLTSFFREPHHFEALTSHLASCGSRIRIWSAGCSTGQEPYSIAMTLAAFMADKGPRDIRILATDIDTDVLATAGKGIYSAEHVEDLPANMRRFTQPLGADSFRMTPAIRNLIAFKRLNLIESWPIGGPFDAIFCRNTAIYFEKPMQKQIYHRMANLLRPGGLFCVGHSETLHGFDLPLKGLGGSMWMLPEGAV